MVSVNPMHQSANQAQRFFVPTGLLSSSLTHFGPGLMCTHPRRCSGALFGGERKCGQSGLGLFLLLCLRLCQTKSTILLTLTLLPLLLLSWDPLRGEKRQEGHPPPGFNPEAHLPSSSRLPTRRRPPPLRVTNPEERGSLGF
ncbi:hypothetical protein Taro_008359 [Colocasia esculenta]|uniref:Uncharacterized protein n=1 Tax=Colocasia esculenta TaxID=4460 RepID=A0A843U1N1_COLES|nr:hypothetical protein [Colocasia esculenta]